MANAAEYLRGLRPALVPVPAVPQEGICPVCRSAPGDDWPTCYLCSEARARIGDDLSVLPISMSEHLETFHAHLNRYKNAADDTVRTRLTMRLAALLAVFMSHHKACVGQFDVVTTVPSVRRVAMKPIVSKLARFQRRYDQVVVAQRDSGRIIDPGQFGLTRSVAGERVLLLDDTFTSGAKLFSTTLLLMEGGAEVIGPVVLGRHVHPSKWPPGAELMDWLGDREWVESRCARCAGERRDEGAML